LSAYSLLAAMSKNDIELHGVVLQQRDLDAGNAQSQRGHRSMEQALLAAEWTFDPRFSKDPVGFFVSLGAIIGASQKHRGIVKRSIGIF
jgi:hypothetical protein